MDGGVSESDFEREEDDDGRKDILRDRFRLSVISIAEAEAKKNNMEISQPVMSCISDLAFKVTACSSEIRNTSWDYPLLVSNSTYTLTANNCVQCKCEFSNNWTKAEQLAKDLELFAQHASRKSVNMEDVILSAHRNEHVANLLRSFSHELKGKEPQSERKRKKASKKEDKATSSALHIS